jgi:hypothetical protein
MKMKSPFKAVIAAILTTGILAGAGYAADSATQTVTFEVTAINELSISGNPAPLTVSTATAGGAPNSVSDSTTSYSITTNETNRKITGALNTDMPSGVTLSVSLAAPAGATSAGPQALSTTAADLVTGISTLNETAKTITYQLSAASAAGVVPSGTRTVTLTITAGGV